MIGRGRLIGKHGDGDKEKDKEKEKGEKNEKAKVDAFPGIPRHDTVVGNLGVVRPQSNRGAASGDAFRGSKNPSAADGSATVGRKGGKGKFLTSLAHIPGVQKGEKDRSGSFPKDDANSRDLQALQTVVMEKSALLAKREAELNDRYYQRNFSPTFKANTLIEIEIFVLRGESLYSLCFWTDFFLY